MGYTRVFTAGNQCAIITVVIIPIMCDGGAVLLPVYIGFPRAEPCFKLFRADAQLLADVLRSIKDIPVDKDERKKVFEDLFFKQFLDESVSPFGKRTEPTLDLAVDPGDNVADIFAELQESGGAYIHKLGRKRLRESSANSIADRLKKSPSVFQMAWWLARSVGGCMRKEPIEKGIALTGPMMQQLMGIEAYVGCTGSTEAETQIQKLHCELSLAQQTIERQQTENAIAKLAEQRAIEIAAEAAKDLDAMLEWGGDNFLASETQQAETWSMLRENKETLADATTRAQRASSLRHAQPAPVDDGAADGVAV